MTRDKFWDHVRASRRRDPDEHSKRLTARLAKLPVTDVVSFGRWWETALGRAHTWKLWGAAYLINGGCSDDGFHYFRGWLILQGRDVFTAAVRSPDTLDAVLRGAENVELGGSPAFAAYEAASGRDDYYDAIRAAYPKLNFAYSGLDDTWDFEDDAQMRRRYPKLFVRYNQTDDL